MVADMRAALEDMDIAVDTAQLGDKLPMNDIISLLDLEEPLLHGLDSDTFARLIETLKSLHKNMLWLTRASQVNCKDPKAAMVLGFSRTVRTDLGINLFTVEMDNTAMMSTSCQNVIKILLRINTPQVNPQHSNPDYEFAISNGNILVPRVHWQTVSEAFKHKCEPTEGAHRIHLNMKTPGLLHTMYWSAANLESLKDGQIQIQPKAAGLNFRVRIFSLPFSGVHANICNLSGYHDRHGYSQSKPRRPRI